MFQVNDDLSIYVTRGDMVYLKVTAENNGEPYTFQPGEVVRFKVFAKKDCTDVVLQKDFPVTDYTQGVEIVLDGEDTKIGEVISKPRDLWYEVELNPFDEPMTIIGYGEDGPMVFKLFPEGADLPEHVPAPEVIKVIDDEFDMTSERPIQNQVIARAFANLEKRFEDTHAAVAELHITPDMFGAIGDGESDDSAAFQACFDNSEGKTIIIPDKKYVLKTAIKLNPKIYEYKIRGLAGTRTCFPPDTATDRADYHILCHQHFLDGTGEDGHTTKYCLKISDIKVKMEYNKDECAEKNFLHNISAQASIVNGVTVLWADHIIKGGVGGVTVIDKCQFMNVRSAFVTDGDYANTNSPGGFVDGTITNCYINGNAIAGDNATLIKCVIFSTMRVTNCYIDFFKEILAQPIVEGAGYFGGTLFSCCTFDVLWRVFACGNYRDYVTFDTCHFWHISQESVAAYFSAPDAEMLNDGAYTKCGILVSDYADKDIIPATRYENVYGVCFTNNRVEGVDYPFYIGDRANYQERIIEKGNTYTGYKGDSPVYFWMYPTKHEKMQAIYFEAMNDKDYTELPQIAVSFKTDGSVNAVGDIKCFEGMRIYYNGVPAIMHNFRWYDYAGNVLS